jgi:hypothetical protein
MLVTKAKCVASNGWSEKPSAGPFNSELHSSPKSNPHNLNGLEIRFCASPLFSSDYALREEGVPSISNSFRMHVYTTPLTKPFRMNVCIMWLGGYPSRLSSASDKDADPEEPAAAGDEGPISSLAILQASRREPAPFPCYCLAGMNGY